MHLYRRELSLAGNSPPAGLHQAAVQRGNLFNAGVTGVARAAGISKSAFGKKLHILVLDDALQIRMDGLCN